jgi:hypothetical protein
MPALSRVLAPIICITVLSPLAQAAPPQPPLTNATLSDWRDERTVIWSLQDNAFLHDEAAQVLSAQVAVWNGGDVVLNLDVAKVTKEAVICRYRIDYGTITIRNQQPAAATTRVETQANLSLRIGDVVPLEVARRLRMGDVVVVKGVVTKCNYPPGGEVNLEIGEARIVALVSLFWTNEYERTYRSHFGDVSVTPHFPSEALAAGEEGEVVFEVVEWNSKLDSSSGNASLDAAVASKMQSNSGGGRPRQGRHRFKFEILSR